MAFEAGFPVHSRPGEQKSSYRQVFAILATTGTGILSFRILPGLCPPPSPYPFATPNLERYPVKTCPQNPKKAEVRGPYPKSNLLISRLPGQRPELQPPQPLFDDNQTVTGKCSRLYRHHWPPSSRELATRGRTQSTQQGCKATSS